MWAQPGERIRILAANVWHPIAQREDKANLDWECFRIHAEASIRAAELAVPDEAFTIEEVSSECPMLRVMTGSER